jgi:hypothetical protein
MLKILDGTEGNIIGVRASGEVTDKDYSDVLIPKLDIIFKEHNKARLLYYTDDKFTGWKMENTLHSNSFNLLHKDDYEKVAMVGAPRWVELGIKLNSHLMKVEIKVFSSEELKEAWDWIKS